MIEYNPEDVPETNDYAPWEKGNYESEIIEADKMQSKAGNDMIRLNLVVTNDIGGTTRIYDYVVIPNTLWKLKSLCRCFSIEFDGTLDEKTLIGRRIEIQVDIDKGNEKYPPKNIVKKYIDGIGVQPKVEKQEVASTPPVPEDDIPF
jgi:hypothetical protein